DYSVDDIKNHCKNLDIRVLFCFDITADNRDARAFKLAVLAQHKELVTNNTSWPKGVFIRGWNTKQSEQPNLLDRSSQEATQNSNDIVMSDNNNTNDLI